MAKRILGIVGSYRKNGVIDTLVTNVLSGAQEQGAETEKIYLIDKHIEFCTTAGAAAGRQGTSRANASSPTIWRRSWTVMKNATAS